MSSSNPHPASGSTEAKAFGAREITRRIAGSGTHLWLVVIAALFALTLAIEVLDLVLWIGRGSRYGLSFLCWTPAIVRVALLTALAGAASYFFRRAGDLKRANEALTQDLDSQMRTLDEKNAQLNRLRQLSEAFISQIDLGAAPDLALENGGPRAYSLHRRSTNKRSSRSRKRRNSRARSSQARSATSAFSP